VKVDFIYNPDPLIMAKEIADFTFNQCRMMDFRDEPSLIETLMKGVMDRSSVEYKLFTRNLQLIITRNIKETGFDPRIDGPPAHMQTMSVQIVNKPEPKPHIPPHYLSQTQSI
jgi:hypothetical protein